MIIDNVKGYNNIGGKHRDIIFVVILPKLAFVIKFIYLNLFNTFKKKNNYN